MPTPLIIEKKLTADTNYIFRIDLTLGDVNTVSRNLTFKTPKAMKLLSRLGNAFTYKTTTEAGDVQTNTDLWETDRFVKFEKNNSYFIKLRMVGEQKDFVKLNKQDKPTIKFKTNSSAWLSGLHNEKGTFVDKVKSSDDRILITFQITKTLWNGIAKPKDQGQDLVPASNKIELSETTKVTKTSYQINISPEIASSLIKINNVHDILVFGYRQYDGDLNSKTKRYYLEVADSIKNETTNEPLSYSKAVDLFYKNQKQILNFTKKFDPKDGKKFIVYATVIRYTKVDNQWTGKWLQINAAEEPIWARAVVETASG